VIHIVQWGENLTSIAQRYGTSIQAIVETNGLFNPNRIYAGQRLLIRVGGSLPPASGQSYTVQLGDTLTAIADRYGVSASAIARANNLVNPNRIYAGQRLLIPSGSVSPPTPPTPGTYYSVQSGDTLARIAMRYGVSMWWIVQANNIANPNLIYPGQQFYIPAIPPTSGWVKPGCEHLAWPREGTQVSGRVEARGTANLASFGYYKLEFRKGGLDEWHYVTGADKPVLSGAWGIWDTRAVSDGRYLFRLVIVDRVGNYPPPCEITVDVKNAP
jgi:LysM repeat protein